jgi:hypothetical protein
MNDNDTNHPETIVQRRDNSMSRWETVDDVIPEEVPSMNRDYGWEKYRVMRKVTYPPKSAS